MKERSTRNKTLRIAPEEIPALRAQLTPLPSAPLDTLPEGILCGDAAEAVQYLPPTSVDLLFLDPPYNMTKEFGGLRFRQRPVETYTEWLEGWIVRFKPLLRPGAAVYICGDWHTSASIQTAASRHFLVHNRITWEREKGRGAKRNWKNASEDIWFCTHGPDYVFNLDAVKLRRRVIAPYRNGDGSPRDWQDAATPWRDTCPSNFWNDITVPFWSMAENTDHPTQKSEKLLARLILASTQPGGMVLDPFAGSGTACVVARKLGRRSLGIEQCEEYCLMALKRLADAAPGQPIQGYRDGVFWERNSSPPLEATKEQAHPDHGTGD